MVTRTGQTLSPGPPLQTHTADTLRPMTVTDPIEPLLGDLAAATAACELASAAVGRAAARLADLSDGGKRLDDHQVIAYDLAHASAGCPDGPGRPALRVSRTDGGTAGSRLRR